MKCGRTVELRTCGEEWRMPKSLLVCCYNNIVPNRRYDTLFAIVLIEVFESTIV